MRNIELKARLRDPAAARQAARRLSTSRLGELRQVDTYFNCRAGRLKLRQMDDRTELIWYERPDSAEAKASDYQIVEVADGEALKLALAGACGVKAVVTKRREVFLYHNVRIHLDDVQSLGAFIEFEAVLGPETDDQAGREQLAWLSGEFGLAPADFVETSYAEMLA